MTKNNKIFMDNVEKVYIIQPILNDNFKILHDEAVALIESAGALYCGSGYQTIKDITPATFIGSGKLVEIRDILHGLDGVTILFNGELSPSQTLNISAVLDGRKVIDRTTLILDIFARNALSSEGKIQVELAQLRYIYPRLKGKGAALSRLGGGIGTRGPGETQLETDRRYIRSRIKYLEKRLSETQTRRSLQQSRRQKNRTKVIALVGYTNTGKSSLMNLLTGSKVLEKDALFATLDPTARKLEIDGIEFLLIDTVGFIQDLPHDIIEAFQSTLESAVNCDLALFIAGADSDYDMQFNTTTETLTKLGFHKKLIRVLNKCDLVENQDTLPSDCICISVKHNIGIEKLKEEIVKCFKDRYLTLNLLIPYPNLSEYSALTSYVKELKRDYTDYGIKIVAVVDTDYAAKMEKFLL